MKNIKKRILSLLIALSIILTDTSISVLGKIDEVNITHENDTELFTNEENSKDVEETFPVEELSEYRSENEKRFLMSDKSIKAVVYSEPIHYKKIINMLILTLP